MLLTDRFVYIHTPSTGGTFVTKAINDVYGRRVASGDAPALIDTNKHGPSAEIPESHQHLPVVSNIRHPLDRYVALYEYSWWRKHEMPGISRGEIREIYPAYPEIAFDDFVELASAHFNEIKTPHLAEADRPGYLTEQFVRLFFRDPDAALARFGRDYLASGEYRQDMYEMRFLRTERLADDLCELLESFGFTTEETAEVRGLDRISPPRIMLSPLDFLRRRRPRRTVRDWESRYDERLANLVRQREWFLFGFFDHFDTPS